MVEATPAPIDVLARLERWGAERDWVGPDPYEGLNSPLGRVVPSGRGRQVVTQVYKRLPFAPPWPLRCRPTANAKALALALSGYATPGGRRLAGAEESLERLPRRLGDLTLGACEGSAWGYPFPVQTRNIRYAPSTPNAIATCFVVGSLLDAHAATGDPAALELALSARPFLLSLLMHSEHGAFFAYIPSGSDLIHNANLMVCGTLARLHRYEPAASAPEAIREAVATTTGLQRADGCWPYGEAPNFGWVDNFHTAYTLEALCQVEAAFGLGTEALERGCRAWLDGFIEADGWARYFHDRRHPLETHSCASAIDLLCRPAISTRIPERIEVARRIADRAIAELWLADEGRFAFRVSARGRNERAFMRWTNAPMFRALARLVGEESAAG